MIYGYARVSTFDQAAGLDAQRRDLKAAGCDRILVEQVSSVDVRARAKLREVLDHLHPEDVLVVTKLDRLARSVVHLLAIVEEVQKAGATLRVLSGFGASIETPTGRMLLTILGAVAEFERGIMLERQREGIAKAKSEGRYKGRAPTARAKGADVRRLAAEGVGPTGIAKQLGIGRASVYRILNAKNAGTT